MHVQLSPLSITNGEQLTVELSEVPTELVGDTIEVQLGSVDAIETAWAASMSGTVSSDRRWVKSFEPTRTGETVLTLARVALRDAEGNELFDHRSAQPEQASPYSLFAHVVFRPFISDLAEAGNLGLERRACLVDAQMTHGKVRSAGNSRLAAIRFPGCERRSAAVAASPGMNSMASPSGLTPMIVRRAAATSRAK